MSNEQDNKALEEKVLQLMQTMVEQESELRKKYAMEDKFRFIRERLQMTYQQLEQEVKTAMQQGEQEIKKSTLLEDEVAVYVYLYNAHGAVLSSWQNLLTPKVFYEYSVNRPIYMEKSHIQTLLRSKKNQTQHAYLTVAIKSAHIISSAIVVKDSLENPLIKIKEGSLSFNKLLCFTCNDQEYILNSKNELIKKP